MAGNLTRQLPEMRRQIFSTSASRRRHPPSSDLKVPNDLDADGAQTLLGRKTPETALASSTTTAVAEPSAGEVDPGPSGSAPLVEWCVCGRCRPMPQAIENKCCQERTYSTLHQYALANYVLILMYWNCVFVIWVTSGMIGKTTAQEHSEKLLIDNLYWPDMGTWGEATDVCPSCVVLK